MKTTSTPKRNNVLTKCSFPNMTKGVILYNIPTEYNKNKIKDLLFDPNEISNIVETKLFKVPQQETQLKTFKLEVIFKETTVIENIIKKLNGFKLDDTHMITAKRLTKKNSYDFSTIENKDTKHILGKSKQRDVIGAKNEGFRRKIREKRYKEKSIDTLFIRNLDYGFVDKMEMAKFFEVKPENVFIPLRKCLDLHTHTCFYLPTLNRGFALVKFGDGGDIYSKVEKYDHSMFEKRHLIVKVAYKRNEIMY